MAGNFGPPSTWDLLSPNLANILQFSISREKHAEETSELSETVEMATLDKEMAEEKAETLQLELEAAKERIEELTLDLVRS